MTIESVDIAETRRMIEQLRQSSLPPKMPPVAPRLPEGDNGGMEARVKALEDALGQVRTDVAVVRSNYATREDMHKEIHAQTWKFITWMTGINTLIVAAVYFIAKHT